MFTILIGYYAILIILTIIAMLLLFTVKNRRASDGIFIFTLFWMVFLAIMAYTAQPANYLFMRVMAVLFGILAIPAGLYRFKWKKDRIAAVIVLLSSVMSILWNFI